MALFESGNPALSEKRFTTSIQQSEYSETMTVRGAINKFGFLLLMVLAGAAYTWTLFTGNNNATQMPTSFPAFAIGGAIVGFILAFVIIFKAKWAGLLSPIYSLCQGLFLGAISVIINNVASKNGYEGIVFQAVGLTFGVAIASFLLYNFKIIKPTKQLRSMFLVGMVGVLIFCLVNVILNLSGVDTQLLQFGVYNKWSVIISLFFVALASIKLILDFGLIEQGAEAGAPKYMEWYGAFGLMVTMIWLYMQILRLLSYFIKR